MTLIWGKRYNKAENKRMTQDIFGKHEEKKQEWYIYIKEQTGQKVNWILIQAEP